MTEKVSETAAKQPALTVGGGVPGNIIPGETIDYSLIDEPKARLIFDLAQRQYEDKLAIFDAIRARSLAYAGASTTIALAAVGYMMQDGFSAGPTVALIMAIYCGWVLRPAIFPANLYPAGHTPSLLMRNELLGAEFPMMLISIAQGFEARAIDCQGINQRLMRSIKHGLRTLYMLPILTIISHFFAPVVLGCVHPS